jgi:hypothetical protein
MKSADAAVLVMLVARHFGYYHVPKEMQAGMYSILASLLILVAVLNSELAKPIKAWAMTEETMSAGCSAVFVAWPWETPSNELCSDIIGVKIGVFCLLWLALALRATYTVVQVTKGKK